MIYRLPPLDEPVDQGDLVEHCPIAFVAGFDPAHPDAVELGCERRQVAVMTQACDLANRKTSMATVAVIHDARSLVDRGLLSAADVRGPVRAGRVYGWYFLPASSEHGLSEMIVDFRQVSSIPLDFLTALCRNGQPTNGLAIASVILGLLSILYTLIAAIPAVLLGCLALSEIKHSQGQKGRGLALAGLALGVLGILLTFVYAAILAPIVLPAVERNDLFAKLQQLAEATEVSDSPMVAGLRAVVSFPAFLLGPFLVVWGLVDWRPVREHKWRWGLVAISFATLAVNPALWADPWCRLFLTGWWFANIPGYVVFWIVASSDSRNRYVAPRRRAKKPSHPALSHRL